MTSYKKLFYRHVFLRICIHYMKIRLQMLLKIVRRDICETQRFARWLHMYIY